MNPESSTYNPLPEGIAVLQLAIGADGVLWAATNQGLFYYSDCESGWQVAPGLNVTQVNAVLAINRLVVAGGVGMARSLTAGQDWLPCLVEQSQAPVNCFTASPRFNQDNVLLAGTEGDGILRSIDGGRFWTLSNFGLRDFTVLSLAVGGAWERKELTFAGTLSGIYCSPNGGRAWRFCGLEGLGVQALAVDRGPNESTLTIYAGLETNGMQVSRDSGLHWEPVNLPVSSDLAVNALICPQPGMILGATSQGLWCSRDFGASWELLPEAPDDIICLTVTDNSLLYAGCVETGVWRSKDHGRCWVKL